MWDIICIPPKRETQDDLPYLGFCLLFWGGGVWGWGGGGGGFFWGGGGNIR